MTDQETIIRLVHYINRLVEGDDILDELQENMHRWGFWDEDGYPIIEYDEIEDD